MTTMAQRDVCESARSSLLASPQHAADEEALPTIRRESLVWADGGDGRSLLVGMTLENPYVFPIKAVPLTLSLAGFGAFIPGRPVTTVMAPDMDPGDRKTVTARVVTAPDGGEPTFPINRVFGADGVGLRLGGALETTSQRQRRRLEGLVYAMLESLAVSGGEDVEGDLETLLGQLKPLGYAPSAEEIKAFGVRVRERRAAHRPSVSHGSERSMQDPLALARQMFQEAYDLTAPHYCRDEATHLVPKHPVNVLVHSPSGRVVVHRHMGFFEHVRPGNANPMPFRIAARRSVVKVAQISEGWAVELAPNGLGAPVPSGAYLAVVTPPQDATTGSLILNVRDVKTGEVCPVEWYWTGRRNA